MTGKQRFQEVQFLDGSSGFCTCGDDTHHIARTGKQRVLEILQQLASDQCDKVNIDKLAITEALDSIEEVVKEVLGEEARFRKSDDDLDRGVEIGYNTLLAEQLGRWESK